MRFRAIKKAAVPDDVKSRPLAGNVVPGQFDDAAFASISSGTGKEDNGCVPTRTVLVPHYKETYCDQSVSTSTSFAISIASNNGPEAVEPKKQSQNFVPNESAPNQGGVSTGDITGSGDPTEVDVLCGRGGGTNNHIGNKYFRQLVEEHRDEYFLSKKHGKGQISRKIVSIIQARGGRYLKRDDSTGKWCDIGDKQAALKTSQALREGLDVKKRQAFLVAQSITYVSPSQPNRTAGSYSGHGVYGYTDNKSNKNGKSYKRQRIAGPCS